MPGGNRLKLSYRLLFLLTAVLAVALSSEDAGPVAARHHPLSAANGGGKEVAPVGQTQALSRLAKATLGGLKLLTDRGADGLASPGEAHEPSVEQTDSTVAEAAVSTVEVFADASGEGVIHRLSNPQESGAPLVFLVQEDLGAWLKVLLPVRPNGSTGWIRRADVVTYEHDFRIVVELSRHRITVVKGGSVFLQEPIAVGKRDTPTPGGLYYIKELLQPPDPNTIYGPFAYGLSGFSNVLSSFAGGEGVIGIHGNNDASVLGTDVSSGCIRMSNTGITMLAKALPLGVPVEIQP